MHRKYKRLSYVDLTRPTVFAHRGSSAHAPENTLAAFELAAEQGADAIELDVKLSADGQVIVIHDESVDRTTNGTGRVKALTLQELKQLDAGAKFSPYFKSQEIPTLEEVLETVGDKIFINIELTNYSSPTDDLPERVISLLKKHNSVTGIMLTSFNILALVRARNLLPKIPLGFLTQRGNAEAVLRTRIIRFSPLMALHPAYDDITPSLIQSARQFGCRIHTYTVNQPELMVELFRAGVDGIFTDDPHLAKKVIADQKAVD